MMKWLTLILLLPLSLFAIYEEPHFLTAYIGSPGQIDCLLSYSKYSTNHFWNNEGKKRPTYNKFSKDSYLIYSEYAINSTNSCFFHGGYSLIKESLNGNSCAFKDSEIGWKNVLFENDATITLQVLAIIPSGQKKSSIRYGKTGGELGLLYSNSFTLFNYFSWVDCNIGYRLYANSPSDQVNTSVTLGLCLSTWLQLLASAQLDYGLNNGQCKWNLNNIAFHPKYRLLEVQFEIRASICSNMYASLGIAQHVWGRNVGSGGGFFGGVWFNY